MYKSYYESPIGVIEIKACEKGISAITFLDKEKVDLQKNENIHIKNCLKQIDDYFKGKLTEFNFAIDIKGTDFQMKVWNELKNISYGTTASYNEIAKRLGDIKKVRAAANANRQNPISIAIPCHRIIGSDGSLTGYAGGLHRKKWLLNHEAKFSKRENQLSLF